MSGITLCSTQDAVRFEIGMRIDIGPIPR